jgi:hypothetical protein
VVFIAMVLVLLAPLPALADDSVGALRLGAGTNLLGWQSRDGRLPTGGDTHSEDFDVGILSPSLTLDVGVLVHEWFAVGVLGGVRYSDHTQPIASASGTVETTSTEYGVLGYVESSFRVDVARPFLRLGGGVRGTSLPSASSPAGSGVITVVGESSVEGVFSAMLGAHLFVVDDFSISPFVSFTYDAGSATSAASMTSTSVQDVTMQLGVELLGWIATAPAYGATTAP